jgi:hypothetical protein
MVGGFTNIFQLKIVCLGERLEELFWMSDNAHKITDINKEIFIMRAKVLIKKMVAL